VRATPFFQHGVKTATKCRQIKTFAAIPRRLELVPIQMTSARLESRVIKNFVLAEFPRLASRRGNIPCLGSECRPSSPAASMKSHVNPTDHYSCMRPFEVHWSRMGIFAHEVAIYLSIPNLSQSAGSSLSTHLASHASIWSPATGPATLSPLTRFPQKCLQFRRRKLIIWLR
jgi:hypothetical protein